MKRSKKSKQTPWQKTELPTLRIALGARGRWVPLGYKIAVEWVPPEERNADGLPLARVVLVEEGP